MMETVNVLLQIKFKLRIDQVHRQILTALLSPVRRLQIFFSSKFGVDDLAKHIFGENYEFFMLPNDRLPVSSVILLRQSTKQYGRGLVCGELTLVLIMKKEELYISYNRLQCLFLQIYYF